MIFPLSSLPPSVNSMYIAKGRHRYKTMEYTHWIVKTLGELRRYPPFYCEKYSCDIRIPFALKDRGDIDNKIKGISDIFVKAKLMPDDRHCLDMRIRYVAQTQGNKVEVEFTAINTD